MTKLKLSNLIYLLCAIAVGATVLAVMGGPLLGEFVIETFHLSRDPMPLTTATCFLLASAAILLQQRYRYMCTVLGALVVVIGAATFCQLIFGIDYGIDNLFLDLFSQDHDWHPRHMAPNAALAFTLVGIAIFVASWWRFPRHRQILIIAIIGSIVIALGTVPLIGNFIKGPVESNWDRLTHMTVRTAVCFILTGIGLIAFVRQKSVSLMWLPVSIFIGFVVVTTSLYAAVLSQENVKIDLLLDAEASEVSNILNIQLTGIFESLDRMAKRWDTQGGLPMPYWESDAEAYLQSFQSMSAISLTDADNRIIDIMPKTTLNQSALGFKLDTDPVRAEVISRVMAAQAPKTSHVLKLRTGKMGFLYINPLTVNEKFNGLLIAVFEINNLFTHVMQRDDDNLDYVVTISENNVPVFTNQTSDIDRADRWAQTLKLHNQDMDWTIEVEPTAKFIASRSSLLSVAILIVGLLTAFLMSLCAYLALNWRAQKQKLSESETLNNAILSNAGSCIIAVDTQSNAVVFNRAAERLLGYDAPDILGKPLSMLLFHDMEEVSQRERELTEEFGGFMTPGTNVFLEKLIRDGVETRDWTYIRKDGYRFPVTITSTLLRDERGVITGFMGIAQDITLQKQQQQELKVSEETFRAAMENASIGMALVSPAGQWLRVNKSLCEMLGYTSDEFSDMTIRDVTSPDDIPKSISNLQKILSGEINAYESEKRYLHKNGHIVWALLNVSIVRNNDGTPNYLVAQIHNINERKEMEQMKDEFVSIVSHELRTPLTSIRGSLGLIVGSLSKDLPAQVAHLIGIAHKNAERLILLINDILDIDKIAAGKMRFDLKHENVAQFMQQAVEANRAYAHKFNVDIALAEIPPDLTINVDADRLMQALSNLLSNAAKFSKPGGIVEASVETRGNKIRINVHDSGSGIPEEFRARIFGKFLQADSSVRREKGGTGLGLHITREIVTHMEGAIDFDSVLGEGTTFWIEFPNPLMPTVASMPAETFEGSANARRILICEDDMDVATILKMQMEKVGFAATIALSIADARAKLLEHDYMALTLDLAFPQENGVDFIRELRANKVTRDLPIVVISAQAEEGRRKINGDAIGIVDWLTKPLREEHLIKALERAVVQKNGNKPRVLHVEDDRDLSQILSAALSDRAELVNVETLREAKTRLRSEVFDLVVLDIGLPDGNGLALLSGLQDLGTVPIPVLILSAHEAPEDIRARVASTMVKSRMSETKIVETILSLISSKRGSSHVV
jgi:PAS domain S-box-containing protein